MRKRLAALLAQREHQLAGVNCVRTLQTVSEKILSHDRTFAISFQMVKAFCLCLCSKTNVNSDH